MIEVVDKEFVLNREDAPTAEELNNRVFDVVDENPAFPGDVFKWLSENIMYPASCIEQGIEGRVVTSFIVNADGSISDIHVVRSPDLAFAAEAERVINAMPKWKPGKLRGKPVRVKYSLPILFKLSKPSE